MKNSPAARGSLSYCSALISQKGGASYFFDTAAPLADEDRSASTVPSGWNYWNGHLGSFNLMVADATEISSGNIEAD